MPNLAIFVLVGREHCCFRSADYWLILFLQSGTERRLSEDDCRRVPASDAANGSDGRGDRISSVGSSNSAPGRRTASCDERLAELFPAMFATSDDQEADAASSHHSEEPLFPVNTKITDPSVLAAKLFGSPSSHQRCNTVSSHSPYSYISSQHFVGALYFYITINQFRSVLLLDY